MKGKAFLQTGITAMTYSIVDIQTKAVVGKPYNDKARARNQANKLDLKYGAIRYTVRTNYAS